MAGLPWWSEEERDFPRPLLGPLSWRSPPAWYWLIGLAAPSRNAPPVGLVSLLVGRVPGVVPSSGFSSGGVGSPAAAPDSTLAIPWPAEAAPDWPPSPGWGFWWPSGPGADPQPQSPASQAAADIYLKKLSKCFDCNKICFLRITPQNFFLGLGVVRFFFCWLS